MTSEPFFVDESKRIMDRPDYCEECGKIIDNGCECDPYGEKIMTSDNTDAPIVTEEEMQHATDVAEKWIGARLNRAEAFAVMANVKLDADGICAGVLKDFADLENKMLDGLLNAFADRLSQLGADHAQLLSENAEISTRLSLAVEALEHYADVGKWHIPHSAIHFRADYRPDSKNGYQRHGFDIAAQALANIKGEGGEDEPKLQ